jgi:hypothetical protein
MPLRALVAAALFVASPFASAQTFTDVSDLVPAEASRPFGATIVDVDGDGRDDLVASEAVYRQGDEGFETIRYVEAAGQRAGLGALVGDLDGDDVRDLLVLATEAGIPLRYHPATQQLAMIEGTGLEAPATPIALVQGSILLDDDRDGHLDVLIGNDGPPDILFRNSGDGTFSDVSAAILPGVSGGTYGMAAADYDRDGDADVYIGLCFPVPAYNLLYRRDDEGFVEVAEDTFVNDQRASWGVAWLDYDGDGWLDLFVANMLPSGSPPPPFGTNRLYRNFSGLFSDLAGNAGVGGPSDETSWSAVAADFDNDGWIDLFVANQPEASRLWRNLGDGTFEDATAGSGLEGVTTLPVAAGDVNGDGWVDLFTPHAPGAVPGRLFYNDGGSNGWLSVDLVGIASNRDGIGARVEVTAGELQMVREITAGDGVMSQSHGLRAHVGLGTATSADVTVRWPSGRVDELTGITANQTATIVEGVGLNAPPAAFALTAPADGGVVPVGEAVTLQWEAAADANAVTYTVYLTAPDGTDATFETTEPTFEVPASALAIEGAYHWAVVARDEYSARTSLDNATFTSTTDVANEAGAEGAKLSLEVWPNPVRRTATVRFELAAADAVRLDVVDALGRRVQRVVLGERGAGTHVETVDVNELRAGTYFVRIVGRRSGSTSAAVTRIE